MKDGASTSAVLDTGNKTTKPQNHKAAKYFAAEKHHDCML